MKDSKKITVSKIEIKIGDKVLTLTPAELKELKDVLERTFPSESVKFIPSQPIIIDRPWLYPVAPQWPVVPDRPGPIWEVTCDSLTNVLCINNTQAEG